MCLGGRERGATAARGLLAALLVAVPDEGIVEHIAQGIVDGLDNKLNNRLNEGLVIGIEAAVHGHQP